MSDQLHILRAPFAPEAVKWRVDQKTPDAARNVRCLCYIDSRLAKERCTEADPFWYAEYDFIGRSPGDPIGVREYAVTRCDLTINALTRSGFGQLGSQKMDGKAAKSVVSDAFKRAAVEFHIGAYLYAMPVFKVDDKGYWVGAKGVGGLTPAGVKQLRQQYTKIVTHQKFIDRFGEYRDYGDVADDERSAQPVVEDELAAAGFGKASAAATGAAVKRGAS